MSTAHSYTVSGSRCTCVCGYSFTCYHSNASVTNKEGWSGGAPDACWYYVTLTCNTCSHSWREDISYRRDSSEDGKYDWYVNSYGISTACPCWHYDDDYNDGGGSTTCSHSSGTYVSHYWSGCTAYETIVCSSCSLTVTRLPSVSIAYTEDQTQYLHYFVTAAGNYEFCSSEMHQVQSCSHPSYTQTIKGFEVNDCTVYITYQCTGCSYSFIEHIPVYTQNTTNASGQACWEHYAYINGQKTVCKHWH
jgi:hypothetical protein